VNREGAGPPNGNQNALSHGIVTFRNQVKRRARNGHSLIDRRSRAGRNAVAVGDQLLIDLGGEESCSTAKLLLIELDRRDVYFLDECDRRIFNFLYKLAAKERETAKLGKIKNPKVIGILYSYRASVTNNLARNLQALGLEKAPPKQKSLEEILAEDENETDEPSR
jgi:hypothetical protein